MPNIDIITKLNIATDVQRRLYEFLLDKQAAVDHVGEKVYYCKDLYAQDPAGDNARNMAVSLAEIKSVRDLLVHLTGCEQRSIARVAGESLPPRYEDNAPDTTQGLYGDWRRIRATTESMVRIADATELKREIPFIIVSTGAEDTQTVGSLIYFIPIHENSHRINSLELLRLQGIEPPPLDLIGIFGPVKKAPYWAGD
jgi:uncharacterized damage-inducible protein DinB